MPFSDVIMVPFPKTWTPFTVVDASQVAVFGGDVAPIGLPFVEAEPLVDVTLVEACPSRVVPATLAVLA